MPETRTIVVEVSGECLRCGRCCVDSCEWKSGTTCCLHGADEKHPGCERYPRGACVEDLHDGCGYSVTQTREVPVDELASGWFGRDEQVLYDTRIALGGE